MTDATEFSDDAAELNPLPDPLRPVFEAMSAATDARGKLEALRRTAKDLAQPIRWGDLDYTDIETRLIDLAESHGLPDELTRGAVEIVITNALSTPALSEEPATEAPNGNGGGTWESNPPPDDTPPVGDVPDVEIPILVPAMAFTSADTLADATIPRRRWLVPGRVPMRTVTILSGDGASGKTTILLQLCEAVVIGSDWLGAVIEEPGPALFVTAEEDGDEIHRRLAKVVAHTGNGFAKLGDLHFKCLPGENATLAAPNLNAAIQPTELFRTIEATALAVRPKLIAIEAAADVYAGNENDRGQVRQFVQLLRGLAIKADAAVILIQHPSVAGLAEGQGRSGSTAWRNSARAQLYFAAVKSNDEGEPEGDVRELRVVKSNYSRQGEAVRVTWQDGVFVPLVGLSTPERAAAEATIDEQFLRLLDTLTAQGRSVTDNPSSSKGAPQMFSTQPDAGGIKKVAWARSMERLFKAGALTVKVNGKGKHEHRELMRKISEPAE